MKYHYHLSIAQWVHILFNFIKEEILNWFSFEIMNFKWEECTTCISSLLKLINCSNDIFSLAQKKIIPFFTFLVVVLILNSFIHILHSRSFCLFLRDLNSIKQQENKKNKKKTLIAVKERRKKLKHFFR